MGRFARTGNFAALVLQLWIFSAIACAAHFHDDCCQASDDAECAICVAIHDVPAVALPTALVVEAERVVAVWIIPWVSLVPEEVFFDRPLARGPPAAV